MTVAENYFWWAKQGQLLAQELDFAGVHSYPLWEGKDIDSAMIYTIDNLRAVKKNLPSNTVVVTEAGWATIATEFGERAGEEKQKQYFNDLYSWSAENNITVFFFEAFDEDWKGETANPLGAEKHWGLFTVDRKVKKALYDYYPDLHPVK